MDKKQPRCGKCRNFDRSTLDGYGYCRAAPSDTLRARLVPGSSACWLKIVEGHHGR